MECGLLHLRRPIAVQNRVARTQNPHLGYRVRLQRLSIVRLHHLGCLNEVQDRLVGRRGGAVQPEMAAVLVEGWGQPIPRLIHA